LHIATIGKNTDEAAVLLKEGKLVAIPTETVYGLASNALDPKAVLTIFEAKQRPHFDPLIVHIHDIGQVEKYADWNDERLKKLGEEFWPGPLTLLLKRKKNIPDIVTSGLDHVAIRVPYHPIALNLLGKLDFPLAAPSANPFGYVSPTSPQHVNKQLGDKVAYILNGGTCSIGLESTIVGVEGGKICIYRLGGLSIEAIERIAGKVEVSINVSGDPKAPGQLKSHYAPMKKLLFGDLTELYKEYSNKNLALISFGGKKFSVKHFFDLSEKGDLNEAAANLFKILREADETDADLVIAGEVPDEGLGKAINDRLRRASV
jgi:L-threonylcarbamoyladenylate synthase